MTVFETASSVLFLFPHPDDDVFVGGTLRMLVRQGLAVHAAWATSGGFDGQDGLREQEAARAMAHVGLPPARCHLLRLPDGALVRELARLCQEITDLVMRLQPAVVVAPAFEGGHADHDATSFAASVAVCLGGCESLYEYPCYAPADGPRGLRLNDFSCHLPGDVVSRLDDDARACRRAMVETYASQAEVFRLLGWPWPDELLAREPFRPCPPQRDHAAPPHPTLDSYAHWFNWRSPDRFSHLAEAVTRVLGSRERVTP